VKRIQLAVRDFALPVPRVGSIEVHSGYGHLSQSAEEAHRVIQEQRSLANPKYKTEVKISHSFERGDFVFVVSGRMDGLIEDGSPYIEEIKTAFDARLLYEKLVAERDHPYRWQLLTYAYMYSIQNGVVPAAALYLSSYVEGTFLGDPRLSDRRNERGGVREGDAFELPLLLDVAAYERWLGLRLDELVEEAEQRERDRRRRMTRSETMSFPFARPRSGQLEVVDSIERSFVEGTSLLLQAPTGMGKTAGVIFPTLREAMARGQRLIYVTPKNSQHSVAEDAVERIRAAFEKSATEEDDIRSLTLTAKSKLCFKGEPVCNPEHCEFARDYYGKVAREKLIDKASAATKMNADLFVELGKEHEVCPFELSIDTIARADIVVGDYNYVFAPVGLIGRFTGYGFGDNEKPNLVVDEAHNLPARASDYFSPDISTQDLDACRERIEAMPVHMRADAQAAIHACLSLITKFQPKNRQKQCKIQPEPDPFIRIGVQLNSLLTDYLRLVEAPKPGDPIVTLCRRWSAFTEALGQSGEQFFCTFTVDQHGVHLKITCCDASEHLASCLKEFEHIVAFSATLKPFAYYQQLCGFDPDKSKMLEFKSPFPRSNRKLLVIPQVSTKYNDRARNYDKIAQAIKRIVELRTGNYFVFFPSFAFLRDVLDRTTLEGFEVLQQRPSMAASDVQKFIQALQTNEKPTVIFAVQGGVFSEGVDYPGDALIGAIIVGPALPGFDLERELMREYYERKFGQGFDYAYTYPAMARVVQAAGRVIRSEEDRGLIVLMDRRFTAPAYTATMPGDWYDHSVTELISGSILQDIRSFWADSSPGADG
jgi:DNA excision repair protein ERCC-2